MTAGRLVRIMVVLALLVVGPFWIHRTTIESARVSLYVTAVIGAVTAIYALLTFEILLQNQSMAKAAVDSVILTERGLRFSYSPNLQYKTINTKDPTFKSKTDISPIDTEDYRRAIAEYSEGQQREFVFAVVKNVGRGSATNLNMGVEYDITDSSSGANQYRVPREANVQILESNKAVALCIFFSKVPTRDDRVRLVSATVKASDVYRDALKEQPHKLVVDVRQHHHESDAGCVIQLA